MNHSDWMFQFTRLLLTNQSALFQHIILLEVTTLSNVPQLLSKASNTYCHLTNCKTIFPNFW